MLLGIYYAQNYASIIGGSLIMMLECIENCYEIAFTDSLLLYAFQQIYINPMFQLDVSYYVFYTIYTSLASLRKSSYYVYLFFVCVLFPC